MRYFESTIDKQVTNRCQLTRKGGFVGGVLLVNAQVFQEDDLARFDPQNGSRHFGAHGMIELRHTQSKRVR